MNAVLNDDSASFKFAFSVWTFEEIFRGMYSVLAGQADITMLFSFIHNCVSSTFASMISTLSVIFRQRILF